MNKTCELSNNVKKNYIRNNNKEYNGSNESTEICMQEELCIDDGTVIFNVDVIKERDRELKFIDENNLKELKKNVNDEGYCVNEEFAFNCFCNIRELNIKCVLRFLADCFSFVCAVCIWGILDDIFILMSRESVYNKLYFYLIFTFVFAAVTCSFNYYFSKCERKKDLIYDNFESKV